ncbi:DNRLRE domain-containing protein [Bacillus sp. AFS041924]|uniref:DNRLRE domain-containing protein n=1 Tax=Bacillus sp. AFS041924 TaxID=2033503 RepID=UPI000BFB20F4|nr:DNRLRE domain-containing protein [Bacillus sp. AFS041924]PGS46509.1 hypothetical protein COC46_20890 [Bacillus sp. AFS041924]
MLEFSILEASGDGIESIPVNDSEATYKTEDNQIFYKEIFPQIELRNFTFNQNSKEDIILNSYEGYHQFTFQIKTDLAAIKSENKSISFVDSNEKEVFNLPAPLMTDSNYDEHLGEGVSSTEVTYSLEKIDGGYKLVVNADPNWLKDPARKYPVFIDPTTSISISTDTYVSNLEPTKNYEDPANKWSETLGEYVLPVGYYGTTTGTNYALLKNPIASIKGLNITGATFYAFVTHHYYASPTPNGIWLDRNDTDFSPNSVTWNTKPNSTNIASDSVGINQWAAFDVTSTVSGWADGSIPNYGFKLHTNGNGQTYWKKIVSSANATNKPYLSVNYSIPTPEEKAYSYGDGTGYVDLSWNAVPDAIGYTVWVYNGKEYESFDAGNKTTWSTKGRKIWPTTSGAYSLNHYGGSILGYSEIPIDPSQVYRNSGGSYPTSTHYWFRISVKYNGAESNMSEAAVPTIPSIKVPPSPTGNIYSNVYAGNDGYVELNWNPIAGASGYKVWLFNGKAYEAFDVKNSTTWSTKGKGIWPTATEIANASPVNNIFHTDGQGTDLPKQPYKLYEKMGTAYATSNNFYFRLSAYDGNGETVYSSNYFSQAMPNEIKPIGTITPPTGTIHDIDSETGYIDLAWTPVTGATSYKVLIFNGKDYQEFDAGNNTTWTSHQKGIWPTADEISTGRYSLHNDSLGTELDKNPVNVYENADSSFNINKYLFRIKAYNNNGSTLSDTIELDFINHNEPTINDEAELQALEDEVITPEYLESIKDGAEPEVPQEPQPRAGTAARIVMKLIQIAWKGVKNYNKITEAIVEDKIENYYGFSSTRYRNLKTIDVQDTKKMSS